MKFKLHKLLVAALLAISSTLFAQTNNSTPFSSNTLPPIPTKLIQTSGISVSVIDGKLDQQTAFSLIFENTNNTAVTFTYTLEDKNGNAVGVPHTITMLPNSTIDYSKNGEYVSALTFIPIKDAKLSDYKVEITLN